jgi:hypothetical protein
MEKNIYDSLGFAFRDNVQIDVSSTKKLNLSGPEKQLLLDGEFIRNANSQIDAKFGGNGGKRKTRKSRKLKRKPKRKRRTKRRL